MWNEFKSFALKGNVVDMAVGVIIGTAFGKIVNSLVNDVIMPPLGLLIGNMDFSELKLVLKSPLHTATPVTVNYGLFINTVVNFMIVAFSIFFAIRIMTKLRHHEETSPAPATKECPFCFSMISLKATRCPQCTSNLG